MAITLFGSASTPADGGTNALNPTVITPPASMVAGDLCVIYAQARVGSLTLTMSQTGGQTWANEIRVGSTYSGYIFWCRFNGTWSANPSVSMGGSAVCNTAVMHVFRPSNGANTWEIDVAAANTSFTAGTSPFTKTAPSINTVADSTVTICVWGTADDNSWGNLVGANWAVTGTAQYRNTAGSDQSCTFAHQIKTVAGATGTVSKDQTALGGDAGQLQVVAFKEVSGGSVTHEGSISETFTVSDTEVRVVDSQSSLTETMAITDTDARAVDSQSSLTETIVITDTDARAVDSQASLTEDVVITDGNAKTLDTQSSVNETISITDANARGVNIEASLTESPAVTDDNARGVNIDVSVSESFSVTDNELRVTDTNASVSESIAVTDGSGRGMDIDAALPVQAIILSESVDADIIIYVENYEDNLCIRTPLDEESVCGRSAIYEGGLCGRTAINSEDLQVPGFVDEGVVNNLNGTRVDTGDLNTIIAGDGVIIPYYRADTTQVFADNDIMDCSYHK